MEWESGFLVTCCGRRVTARLVVGPSLGNGRIDLVAGLVVWIEVRIQLQRGGLGFVGGV